MFPEAPYKKIVLYNYIKVRLLKISFVVEVIAPNSTLSFTILNFIRVIGSSRQNPTGVVATFASENKNGVIIFVSVQIAHGTKTLFIV
jgi:hypothetical protein